MSKVDVMFGKWVLLEPIEEDLSKRTSLSLPDDMQKPQNMAKVVLKGSKCTVPVLKDEIVIHEPSSMKVSLQGKTYIIVNEKEIIGKVENE